MNIIKEPSLIERQPSQHETEIPATPTQKNSEKSSPQDLEITEKANQKKVDAEIEEIRASLGIEISGKNKNLRKHLSELLKLNKGEAKRLNLFNAKKLPDNYQSQLEALDDERLNNITIAVIPDDLWAKGNQPSESSAENQLISIKQSYFEAQENPDEISWMIHELAHCQNFLDSNSPKDYQKNMRTFAYDDLDSEYSYPNNPVEKYTFTKQFQYLKQQNKSREDILKMLGDYYDKEDFPFFNRLLDNIYKQ